jgi:hypothetical protein
MNSKAFLLRFGFLVIILSIIACTINIGGPTYPDQSIPVSTEAAGEIQPAVQTAVSAAGASGQIALVLTETELTSFLYYRLKTQSKPLFENPQVYLQDGQIRIYGTAHKGYFLATVSIILTAGINDQGQLNLEMTSADFGPLPIPSGISEAITSIIREAYTGAIGPMATGFRLENVTIDNGTMSITGAIK